MTSNAQNTPTADSVMAIRNALKNAKELIGVGVQIACRSRTILPSQDVGKRDRGCSRIGDAIDEPGQIVMAKAILAAVIVVLAGALASAAGAAPVTQAMKLD